MFPLKLRSGLAEFLSPSVTHRLLNRLGRDFSTALEMTVDTRNAEIPGHVAGDLYAA